MSFASTDTSVFTVNGFLQSDASTLNPALMPSDLLSHSSSSPSASSLVVIDPTVEAAAFLANSVSGADVVVLDANQDGIEQITALLANYEQLSSLHIVSHGAVGQLQLGSTVLGPATLPHYAEQLAQWQDKLSEEADILLYGCDVADGIVGRSFVGQLGLLTGADIAASDDLTGYAALGGDWDLEWTTGDIETNLAFDTDIQNTYQGVYSTSGGLDALLLVGTSSTELEDYTEIRYRLESLGFSVVQKLASSLQLSDTAGMELVVSAAIGGSSILDNLDLPLMVINHTVAKQLDMGIWSTSSIGVGGRTLTIESTEPLLTAGLSGVVNVYDPSGGLTYLEPTSSAIRVGTLAERPYTTPANATPIFAYEEGAALYNGEFALARQVSFLGYTRWVSDLSNQGWQLFDAAVQWAIGEPSAPVEISLALSNDTGVSDSDSLTSDPTLAGQLSTANNITSLQARIGNGQFVSIGTLQSDGTFTLDLEQLSTLNGGGLAYGNYTVEVQAQTASGSTDTELIDFSYEFQQAVLPYSNGAFVPLELAAGQTTFQFGLPNDIANGDQLLVFLLNENDPTDTLLANGAEGNPLLSGTSTYLSYNPSIVSVDNQTVTVDVSSLTSTELDSAMVYFVVFSEFDSPSDDPDYYSYDGYGWGSGYGWGGGGGGGGGITAIQFSSPGWATTGDGGSDPDDPGSGGSGSEPEPEPPTRQFLTQLGGDGYFISYDLLNEDDTFTKPTEIKFGNNVLTLNYSATGAFLGSSNDELLDVVLASVGLTSLDELAAGEIKSSESKSLLPSAQTLQLWDVWSRIGEIAIKPNKELETLSQAEQKQILDLQENVLKVVASKNEFKGYGIKEDFILLRSTATFAQTVFKDLLDGVLDRFRYEPIINSIGDGLSGMFGVPEATTQIVNPVASELIRLGQLDRNSELAWVSATVYAEVNSDNAGGTPDERYAVSEVIYNRATLLKGFASTGYSHPYYNQASFGEPLEGSYVKGVIAAEGQFASYQEPLYNQFMTGITNGFTDTGAIDKAIQSTSAALLAFLTDGKKALEDVEGNREDNFYLWQRPDDVNIEFLTANDDVEEDSVRIGQQFFWYDPTLSITGY